MCGEELKTRTEAEEWMLMLAMINNVRRNGCVLSEESCLCVTEAQWYKNLQLKLRWCQKGTWNRHVEDGSMKVA